jgi:transposase
MPASGPRPGQVAIQVSLAAIFVSLELSRSTWLITSLVPGGGDKMSKHSVRGGDIAGLMAHFAKLRDKAHARARASRLSPFRKPAWTASGFIACWSEQALRAMSLMPPRS